MKPRVLITTLTCSAILATSLTPIIAASTTVPVVTTQNPIPAVDLSKNTLVDVDFSKGVLQDSKNPDLTIGTAGNPQLTTDAAVPGKVAKFDGHSGYLLPYSAERYSQLAKGMTIEAYFKDDVGQKNEHEIFSNQESGGLGLGVQNGNVIFYASVGSGYKQPSAPLRTGRWVHAVGVYDQAAQQAKLYLDGKLVSSVAAPGTLNPPKGTDISNFVIGGDSAKNNQVQSQMTGAVKLARLYDRVLTDTEISSLNQTAQIGKHEPELPAAVAHPGLVGAKDVVIGHTYGLNVHARTEQLSATGILTAEMRYEADKFDFVGANQTLGGDATKVEQTAPGQLKITTTAKLNSAQFERYDLTRLAHVNLKAKASGQSWLHLKTVKADGKTPDIVSQAVTIHAKDAQDYNGDGIIGVGDLALAPDNEKSLIAAKSEIKPYKHVIVLTTDGGGNPWDPKGMYYAKGKTDLATWTTDPAILAKRQNTYTLDLFNNKFAMSTNAHSVIPAISAQNYISMLHGRPWGTLPKDYQATNSSAGQHYFADFGKAQPAFASVFKVLQQHNPHQGAAAFAEWKQILNGITEPDAAVMTQPSASLKSFDDVADYIGKPEFTSTSLVYMQSDFMDGQGHSNGWYNDNYWQQYAKYDGLFKKVMDKLEATGHTHDTLVIANADHGGHGTGHGQDTKEPNTNIFLAMGGETIDSGRRLQGGSNADISALILNALQVPKPNYMLGQVFDKSAFLAQTDLKKKKRQVETVKVSQSTERVAVQLSNLQQDHTARAFELHFDLADRAVEKIEAPAGTTIVQQSVENGELKLVLSFKQQPAKDLVTIKLAPAKTRAAKLVTVKQAMLGTTKGQEVLVDLDNETNVVNDKDLVGVKPDTNTQAQTDTKPGTSTNPDATAKPGTSTNPDATTKPGSTVKPDTSSKPGTAEKPDTTAKPGSTDKPNSSDKPGSATVASSAADSSAKASSKAENKPGTNATADSGSVTKASSSDQSTGTSHSGWLPQTG